MNYPEKKWVGKSDGPRDYVPRLVSENDRSQPSAEQAELHVLACCMVEGSDTLTRCIDAKFTPSTFYFPRAQQLYSIFIELRTSSRPVLLETVAQELMDRQMLETVGGMEWLMEVANGAPTTAHARYMVEKVKEKWILRELIREASDAVDQCYGFNGNLEDLIVPLAARFNRCVEYARAGHETMQQLAAKGYERTIAKLEGRHDRSRELSSGIAEFDRRFGPFDVYEEDFLIGIGAVTSGGKSTFARMLVDAFLTQTPEQKQKGEALKAGMVFLLETTIAKWLELMAARAAGVNSRGLETLPKDFAARYRAELDKRHAMVGKQLMIFEDKPKVEVLVARVEDYLREHGPRSLDFVMVDHLHELTSAKDFRGNREGELAYIAKFLKSAAKRLGLPFFVPMQLNRSPAKDGNYRRPTKNDLRGSGEIENARDRLLLLYMPKEDSRGVEQKDNMLVVMIEVIQEKSRNGPIGHREYWWNRGTGQYTPLKDNELTKGSSGSPSGTKSAGGYGRG